MKGAVTAKAMLEKLSNQPIIVKNALKKLCTSLDTTDFQMVLCTVIFLILKDNF